MTFTTSLRLPACALVSLFILSALALSGGDALAQTGLARMELTAPPDSTAGLPQACCVEASDVPDDAGGALRVSWDVKPEPPSPSPITGFEILRFGEGEEPHVVGDALPTDRHFIDTGATAGVPYQYIVRTVIGARSVESEASPPGIAYAQWFSWSRRYTLVVTLLFCVAVLLFIRLARGGAELFIRKIPGLDAVDDAVGRATEMGRPVLYVPGIETVSEVGTLAALTILGHVAKRVAQHGTPLEVPVADPIVMTTAQEIVRAAYAEAGKLDTFDPSRIAYLTYDQFGYTAGVDGIMMRERPEAVFLLGYFAAESLILAETGHSIGAIQIAGTKETSQLPFFVAACDYTLIGEELFAASSYLSREPVMLGSLKGQDLAKLWIVYFILFAFVVGTIGSLASPEGGSVFTRVFDVVASWFSG
jgi:hypothetical protein